MGTALSTGLCSLSLAMLLGATSCAREPPLAQRMAGPWRATIEYGARTSKDPLVRGVVKFFNPYGGRLHILLDVGAETIEVKRPSANADQEVTQRASFVALDRERIALTTERGQLTVQVHLECNKEGCLAVQFNPEPGSDVKTLAAMGLLFGCDDDSGHFECASASSSRMFFRYAPGAP